MSKQPLTNKSGEVRELTKADFERAKPASEVVPNVVKAAKRTRGRPHAKVTKQQITIRLSPEVLKHFRATGSGWQTRIDDVLKHYVDKRD